MPERLELAIEEEFICMITGTTLGKYYADPITMIEAQIAAREFIEEKYGMGKYVHLYPMLSSYAEASALGLDVVFPDGNEPPWPKPGIVIKDLDEVENVKIRRGHPGNLVEKTIDYFRKMRAHVGDKYNITIEKCVEGPITTAVMLRGQEFFTDIYEEPEKVRRLLNIITENSLDIRRQIEEATGQEITTTWIYDDYAGMLSPQQFKDFAVPCYREIYKRYGKEGRVFHCELLNPEHLKITKEELDITFFNAASAQNLTIESIREVMGQHFDWQVTPSELALPVEKLLERLDEIIELDPPIITLYPYNNTPLENLTAAINHINSKMKKQRCL